MQQDFIKSFIQTLPTVKATGLDSISVKVLVMAFVHSKSLAKLWNSKIQNWSLPDAGQYAKVNPISNPTNKQIQDILDPFLLHLFYENL